MKTETKLLREEYDTFLGIKCASPSTRHLEETVTFRCDVCGKTRKEIHKVTELLHVPETLTRLVHSEGPAMESLSWGFRKRSFWACLSHSENDLDKYVRKLKRVIKHK